MAIPDEIPQGSIEFISVILESDDDLTSATVSIGLSDDPIDPPADWLTGAWPTPGPQTSGAYEARTLAPVDTATLSKAHYKVWARVTDSPEILPRPYGIVRIV